MFLRKKTDMPDAAAALPGRTEALEVPNLHYVNGNRIQPPFPEGMETAIVGMGCFWGAGAPLLAARRGLRHVGRLRRWHHAQSDL